jgi:hypothetical protein
MMAGSVPLDSLKAYYAVVFSPQSEWLSLPSLWEAKKEIKVIREPPVLKDRRGLKDPKGPRVPKALGDRKDLRAPNQRTNLRAQPILLNPLRNPLLRDPVAVALNSEKF